MSVGLFFIAIVVIIATLAIMSAIDTYIPEAFGRKVSSILSLSTCIAGSIITICFILASCIFESASHLRYALKYDHVEFIEFSDKMPNEKSIDWSHVIEQTETTYGNENGTRYKHIIVAWNDDEKTEDKYDVLMKKENKDATLRK